MIQSERIKALNDSPKRDGRYVLYWMQASQRPNWNHAVEYAIRQANDLQLPAIAVFGLTADYPDANARHYAFMLEGLAATHRRLAERGIQLVIYRASPDEAALRLAEDAALIVADRGYLRFQRRWRRNVAEQAPCRVTQIETDIVVPVEDVSDKEEYAARTIRPKIHDRLDRYLRKLEETELERDSLDVEFGGADIADKDALLADLNPDNAVRPVSEFTGGPAQAERLLAEFVEHRLDGYDELRNEPALDHVSHMSPYLHFGQISPLQIALAVSQDGGEDADAYLEELIVRRELSINFCYYNPDYDSFSCLPDWAAGTLADHEADAREVTYERRELERAETHDPYWNAAQMEMVARGKMHNYMRMYWGKKILEWTDRPQTAFHRALYLNNKYELDGRDPNSYAGVAWCFGKHDQAWRERDVFGKTRYMNANGLERKFDMEAYLRRVDDLTGG